MAYRSFSTLQRRVFKKTIDVTKLAEMNSRLLNKVNKPELATAVAQYKENSNSQKLRVQPNDLTVQYKHNKDKVGIVRGTPY